jgi:hypothetical protein
MSSQVSLLGGLLVVLPEETVQDSNQVSMLVLVLAFLDAHKELNSASVVFKNSIDDEEGKGDDFSISLDSFDNLEEKTNVILSLVFLKRLDIGGKLRLRRLFSVRRRSCS